MTDREAGRHAEGLEMRRVNDGEKEIMPPPKTITATIAMVVTEGVTRLRRLSSNNNNAGGYQQMNDHRMITGKQQSTVGCRGYQTIHNTPHDEVGGVRGVGLAV